MEELISIVIPVHNTEKYLKKCLDSIINQTYKNIEIILVEDSSTDNSYEICEKYKKEDSRIKLYKCKNKSAGITRNYGLDMSTGKYIVFVDADDYIELDMCEKMYKIIKENNSNACFTGYNEVLKNGEINIISDGESLLNFEETQIKNEIIFYSVYYGRGKSKFSLYSVWKGMYDLELIKSNKIRFLDEREYLSEDCIFNYEFLGKCRKVTIINEPLYNHTLYNDNSICNNYNNRFNYIKNWYDYILGISKRENIDINKSKKALNERYVIFSIVRIKQEILLSKKSFNNILKEINNILNDKRLIEALYTIDLSNKNFKQKILIYLMKYKLNILIYIMIKIKHN